MGPEQMDYIRENRLKMSMVDMGKFLNISYNSIRNFMIEQGLTLSKRELQDVKNLKRRSSLGLGCITLNLNNMITNFKVHVNQEHFSDTSRVYVVGSDGDKRVHFNLGSDGIIIGTVKEQGSQIDPFLEMRSDLFKEFVKGILEFAAENDIKLETETVLSAKLEATERHLTDVKGYFEKALDNILKRK